MSKPNKKHYLNLRIVVTALSMVVTVSMLIAAATAWLTVNRKAESNGVQMTVQGTSNLVIGQSIAEVQNGTPTFETTFAANPTNKYMPCTHDKTEENYGATGLFFVSNIDQIDPATGFCPENFEESYSPVTLAKKDNYYKEYTVFIASAGESMEDYDLYVSIGTPTNIAGLSDTFKALSIDFYVGNEANEDTYVDTLNIAGLDIFANDGMSEYKEALIWEDGIPDAAATPLKVIMRAYFDGALIKADGDAFIRSEDLSFSLFECGILFRAQ